MFKNLTQEFYRMYKSIETQALIIEKVFNELCQEFDCRHIGKLILWF